MKLKTYHISILAILIGCNQSPLEKEISKIEDYNHKLEQLLADSTKIFNTASITAEFERNDISSIINNESLIREISDETSLKELIDTEKDLLSRWEPIPNFRAFPGIENDTLLRLFRRCATFDRAPSYANRIPAAKSARTFSLSDAFFKAEVPVIFHIIINQQKVGLQGNMINRIRDQIQVLNNVYKKSKIQFKLISIDTTISDSWFNIRSWDVDSTIIKQMTRSLSKNPKLVMNVYILNSYVLGEATYPWSDTKGTSSDYIVINYNTLSGGPSNFLDGKYTEGKTLVHEAGHYLGLWHTFEGNFYPCNSSQHDGCNIGDQVDDTPSQKVCYFDGCNENSDSCLAPGKDPVRNYMGYNPDSCMTEMTDGQVSRLRQCVFYFRGNLMS